MIGLNNLGNTCYLNAALQMLLLNSDFCNLILYYNGGSSDILNNISNFIINYYSCSSKSISPDIIRNIIKERFNMFDGYQQQDSNEFICCLFDIINEEIYKMNNKSICLYSIFGLDIKSRIKCKLVNCLHSNVRNDKELILNLTVEETLEQSINNFKSRELLVNEYKCDNCNIKSIASKRLDITNNSNNLLICLKRFNCTDKICNKISDRMIIPLLYNNYQLHGAIIHSGSYSGGHYIYIGFNNNNWYLFNDDCVSILETNIHEALSHAYFLYYKLIK